MSKARNTGGRLLAVCAMVIGTFVAAPVVQAAPGELDTTFATSGYLLLTNPSMNATALQDDGKLVTVGELSTTDDPLSVRRWNDDGSQDTTFASSGSLSLAIGSDATTGNAVEIQDDGKIVVAGYASEGGAEYRMFVVRLESDGSLDMSFGTHGVVTTDVDELKLPRDIAIASDGSIFVVGLSDWNTDQHFLVAKYTDAGAPDTSFGGDGIVENDFSTTTVGSDGADSVEIQDNGRIVVTGDTEDTTSGSYLVQGVIVRFMADGELDPSFGSAGSVITNFGSETGEANDIVIDTDGSLIVAGYRGPFEANTEGILARYDTTGTLDTSFGTGGYLSPYSSANSVRFNSLTQLPNGKFILSGYEHPDSGTSDGLVARLNEDGTLDSRYGTAGLTMFDYAGNTDITSAAIVAPSGIVFADGWAYTSTGGTRIYTLVKLTGDDLTGPTNPTLTSTSHAVSTWSNDRTVDVNVSGATDADSGVSGFSWSWDTNPTTDPDHLRDAGATRTSLTSPILTDSATWYLHFATVDRAGNWSTSTHLGPFKIDGTLPTGTALVGAPFAGSFYLPRNLAMAWSAADAMSGIAAYSVSIKTATATSPMGAWSTWLDHTTLLGSTFMSAPGTTHCFSVVAFDQAGNRSAPTPPRCTATPFDDAGLKARGLWTVMNRGYFYMGGATASRQMGATLSFEGNGRTFAIVATTCPTCGQVEMSINGRVVRTINLATLGVRHKQVIRFARLAGVRHVKVTMKVVSAGLPVTIEGLGVSAV